MTPEVIAEYIRLRSAGWRASDAYRSAKVRARFRELERQGRVRLNVVVDETPYDDSYIDTWDDVSPEQRERERSELWRRIESEGCWGIETYASLDGGPEEFVDSVWGFVGDDWRDSGYDIDIMRAAIEAAELSGCGDLDPACKGRAA